MSTTPEGSTTQQSQPVTSRRGAEPAEELTEQEAADIREAELAETMEAREAREEEAKAEREAMAERAVGHIGQPSEQAQNALDPNRKDAPPAEPDVPDPSETGGNARSQQARDEAEARQQSKRSEQGKQPTPKSKS
jgi:hypothetical protein